MFSWRLKLDKTDQKGLIHFFIQDKTRESEYGWVCRFQQDYDFSDADKPSANLSKTGCYFSNGRNRKLYRKQGYSEEVLKSGDIIEVKYHQKEKKLEFLFNEVSQGIAYENISNGPYRLVIVARYTKSKIILLE